MSLLMEALKKAEEAKRLASESTSHNTGSEPSLRPMTLELATDHPAAQTGSPLPDLALHIDSVDADLAAVSTSAPEKRHSSTPSATGTTPAVKDATAQVAARNLFAAKKPSRTSAGLWVLLGLCALAAIAIATYFWWQIRGASNNSLVRPASPALSASLAPAPPETKMAVEKPTLPKPSPLPDLQPERPAAPRSSAVEPARTTDTPTKAPKQLLPAPGSQENVEPPVRLSRTQAKPNRTLEQAYDALQAGRLEEARRGYEIVLNADTKNTDALLGMATIAANLGQAEWAQTYYLRALEADPSNVIAQAGVINSRGQADPDQSESRLRSALATQPDSPALHFALGNLYARQTRWAEAQQAYFNAFSADPENPDFIFNLAVSLDHLHQTKLAIQYYQMALSTAEKHRATRAISFAVEDVKNRIVALQP